MENLTKLRVIVNITNSIFLKTSRIWIHKIWKVHIYNFLEKNIASQKCTCRDTLKLLMLNLYWVPAIFCTSFSVYKTCIYPDCLINVAFWINYYFALITTYYMLSGLKQHTLSSHSVSQESEMDFTGSKSRCFTGFCSFLVVLEEDLFPCFFCLPEMACIP